MTPLNVHAVRDEFPIFGQLIEGQRLIYLDSAATTQKPRVVLKALQDHYRLHNANVHRATYALSRQATLAFEGARDVMQRFLNAPSRESVIFTRGATEALNLLAQGFLAPRLQQGDEIIVTALEHHANLLPWQRAAAQCGAVLHIVPLDTSGSLDVAALGELLGPRTRLVALAHVSNVLGSVLPVQAVTRMAHAAGAVVVVDGTQAAAHLTIDVQALDADFYVISSHKMYGPTGVGVLYGKPVLLQQTEPMLLGGEMVAEVGYHHVRYADLPFRLEAGTPPIAEAVAMAAAASMLLGLDRLQLRQHELGLLDQLRDGLSQLPGVRLVGNAEQQIALQSFVVDDWHPHDLARALDLHGIALRAGHHCAMPLMGTLQLTGTLRASLGLYNSHDCVNGLLHALRTILRGSGSSAGATAMAGNVSSGWGDRIQLPSGGWPARYQALLKLGREQSRWSKAEQEAAQAVSGCESRTWVRAWDEGDAFAIAGDSDSALIRGILALMVAQVSGQDAPAVAAFDFDAYLEAQGLWRELSPSRGNGIRAIIRTVHQLAAARLK